MVQSDQKQQGDKLPTTSYIAQPIVTGATCRSAAVCIHSLSDGLPWPHYCALLPEAQHAVVGLMMQQYSKQTPGKPSCALLCHSVATASIIPACNHMIRGLPYAAAHTSHAEQPAACCIAALHAAVRDHVRS